MRNIRFFNFLALAVSSFLLSSCKIETDGVNLVVNSGTLTCAATSSVSSASSGQTFPVTIQVLGGAAPYTLSGSVGNFLTSYTLSQTLTNSTTSSQIQTSSFTVTDNAGRSTTCDLAITVTPITTTNPLSCSATASIDTPAINQSVVFTATATGGSSTYYFTSFIPGGTGVVTASLNQISATQATAGAAYPYSGLNTAVFYVSDSSGNSATCAKTVTVQSVASVSLTASPATTVPATQAITVTATASSFTSTPTFTWSISGSGLNLTGSGNTATVTAVDASVTRTGTVTVVASNGTQSATNTIPVTFTAGSTILNCSISYTPGTYSVGQNVPYSITATTGEALTVTQINVTDGNVVGGVPSQYPSINFYYSGSKLVTALARSTSTGVLCNNGAYLQSTIYIYPSQSAFSCTLSMTPNPSYTYRYILATVTASGAQGGYWLESLTADNANYMVMDNGSTSDSVYTAYSSPIYRYVYFTYPGNWRVTARVRDSAGRLATCDTYETINWYYEY
ncbi:hypothetical protein EBT16_05300 [bacterium]|nr:hypothetical protein [bacterium]